MEDLARNVVNKLIETNRKISIAETITGGGISKELIKIPGSSRVIDVSFVTYSNQSKVDFLNVSEKTLAEYGAVSKESVEEMANGLAETSQADFCLAVSGIAGPGGATATKPVGMVCVALKTPDKMFSDTWMLEATSREAIIEDSIRRCLELLTNSID